MRLEDFPHLPVVKGPTAAHDELKLPDVPVEMAEVEFKDSGWYRPIYVSGIHVVTENPNKPFLVWANRVDKTTGKRIHVLSTYLEEVTDYRPVAVESVRG